MEVVPHSFLVNTRVSGTLPRWKVGVSRGLEVIGDSGIGKKRQPIL